MRLLLEPLDAAAFAPFGQVLERPEGIGRRVFAEGLANLRPSATPRLALSTKAPRALPLIAVEMERHRFSSQAFVPIDVARYLVLVAPRGPEGGPDMSRARAFAASGRQGVNYAADTWHHPLTALDRDGSFAVLTWLDGGPDDEEFVTLAEPVEIAG